MFKKGYCYILLIFIFIICVSCSKKDEDTIETLAGIENLSLILKVDESYSLNINEDIIIEPHNKDIVVVNNKEKVIKGLSEGETKATIYQKDNLKVSKTIKVTVKNKLNFEVDETGEIKINNPIDTLYLDDEYKLDVSSKNNLDLIFESSNPEICLVDENGNLNILDSGIFSIRIYPVDKPNIYSNIEIEIKPYINPEKFIEILPINK